MFTEKNFKNALEAMNFEKISADIYQKNFGENVSMSANLKTKKFSYPEQLQNRDRNNFFDSSHKENFVVFECVNRLLQKGYKPEDIALEKAWHLSHSQKSGRADICIFDENGYTLCIIECKTFGKEFDKELKNLNQDGGQLFSYWQQERACTWLILYTSTFNENDLKIDFKSETVDCSDDKNILTVASKNPEIKTYQNSHTKNDLYDVWAYTYEKKLLGDLLFRNDTVAYKIGVKPLRKSDLKDFSEITSVVNKFEEILRHNNVSDKENAFNRLVALFICKLVDETQNIDDSEVNFQYKIGSDSYEILQDRLQRLHRDGMEKFMDEKIFYLPDDYAENLIQQFFGQDRDKMLSDLQANLRKLKFFTNNDFAFKDVHNEELFYQNGKVLVEVVRLFQSYRIIGAKNLQTLGDLFEQLLDKGFKQDEGQFFTPIPITRFIWESLPLEKFISEDGNFAPPKIIDYACGAGHFLTEGFKAINDFTSNSLHDGWEDKKIFGIEKDYRLARVSKISFFMHGVNKGTVIFGDGLENNFDKFIRPADFDILVSNPPYSVKAFKPHLKLKNKFHTLEKISNEGSEIETLFVERISQLLKPGGIAAVILPSSILNKDGKSFVAARESALQNFFIRAIAEFGSKTFSATGTKTNIVFLQRLTDTPKRFNLLADSVTQIFKDYLHDDWEDKKIFSAWLAKINVDEVVYKKFIRRELDYFAWQTDAYFADYVAAFVDSKDFKDKIKQTSFKALTDDEKISLLNQKFYDFAQEIEREKIQYFAQTYTQTTLIISAPDENSAQEKFLGYSWSNRKGDEGIKISGEGLMFKLTAAVRKSFYGEQVTIPDAQNYFYYLNLADMIDFSGANFTKIIKLTKKFEISYSGKYPLKKLGKYIVQIRGVSYKPNDLRDNLNENSLILLRANNIRDGKINHDEIQFVSKEKVSEDQIIRAGDILISASSGSLNHVGKAAICTESVAGETFGAFCKIIRVVSGLLPEYISIFFSTDDYREFIRVTAAGSNINNLKNEHIDNLKIPVPPIEEQKKIVGEFRAVDDEIKWQEKIILDCDAEIKEKFSEMFGGYEKNISFSKICIDDTKNGEKIPASEYLTEGKFPIIDQSINEIAGYSNLEENFYENLPCIIFGDHTEIFKFVTEKFFLGADGVKILIPVDRDKINEIFLFYMLKTEYKTLGGYSRHFRNLNDTKFYLPPRNLQEKFAEYVMAEENKKISAQKKILELKSARENLVEKYFR